jgi:phenylacetate-CoA ligase
MEHFAQTLVHFQPDFIFGYTSSVYLFAQYLEKQGITIIRPKAVQTAAEKLHNFQRELIEYTFGCKVYDHYAAQEIGVMAAECPEGGLHLAAETKYLEVCNNDQPIRLGEMGETVVTDLTNYAMPFIRYKGGDLATLDDKVCSCGRGLLLLREVMGRIADFFRMPSGKLVSGLYWTLRMREVPGIKRFRAHQSAIDKIEVVYEIDDGFNEEILEAKRQEIIRRLNEPVSLTFRKVDQIPLTRAGKHLFITSDVPIDLSNQPPA